MSYLDPQEAHDRLSSYELDGLPTAGALAAASRRLDNQGPFLGARLSHDQPHAFPRTFTLDGDVEGDVPEAVLDWVALEAFKLTTVQGGGDKPPVTSISHAAAGSVTYARGKLSNEQYIQSGLLVPYQRKYGSVS